MSHDKIEVTWEVADGYAGRTRPQRTKISHSDILDCESEEDVRTCVEDSIREDFEQKISPDFGESVYSEALELWREAQAEKTIG
jgi:23S rRNA U2552 (ribose-2'-O)-methylase RlmE/FtsJ